MNQIATLHSTLKSTDDEYQRVKSLSESLSSKEMELEVSIGKLQQNIEKKAIELATLRQENLKEFNEYWSMINVGKQLDDELTSLQSRSKSMSQLLRNQTYSFINASEKMKKKTEESVNDAIEHNLWSMHIKSNESQSVAERKALREEEMQKSERVANEVTKLENMLKEEKEDLFMLKAIISHEDQSAPKSRQLSKQSSIQRSDEEKDDVMTNRASDVHQNKNFGLNVDHGEDFYLKDDNGDNCYDYAITTIIEEEVIDVDVSGSSRSTPWFQKRKRISTGFRTGAEILHSTNG